MGAEHFSISTQAVKDDVQVQEEVETCRKLLTVKGIDSQAALKVPTQNSEHFRTRTPEQGEKLLQILENVERAILGQTAG